MPVAWLMRAPTAGGASLRHASKPDPATAPDADGIDRDFTGSGQQWVADPVPTVRS